MKKYMTAMLLIAASLLAFFFYQGVSDWKERENRDVVVLDPGHGGKYPGFATNDLVEKDIVLQVAKYTKELLEEQGYIVYLTRDTDEECSEKGYAADLSCRPNVANEVDADLFVSIHANAFQNDPSVRGIETFYFTPFRDKQAAETIARAVADETGLPLRFSKFANYQVLRESSVPGTLIEIGYLTNEQDAKLLSSEPFQRKAAAGIASGIMKIVP